MKRTMVLASLTVLLLAGMTLAQQSAPDLYQQALVQERAAGNLEQAIQLFQQAAKQAANDRALAAKALLGAARSYEKLGQPQARKAYEEIARTYPEQHEQAAYAKERIASLPVSFGKTQPEASVVTPMLNNYCITCHNQTRKSGGLALDQVNLANVSADGDVWEKVLRKLRGRLEPPTGRARPDPAIYEAAIVSIENALDRVNPPALAAGSRMSDLELANRLATFLWGASPDAALLDAVKRGQLSDPAQLEQQTRRMLADPKSQNLTSSFFSKWIHLDNLATIHVSPASRTDMNPAVRENMQRSFEKGQALFPQWDEDLRNSLRRETEMFLDSQVRGDRPATEMWTANYTFVNERLGQYYGIPNVSGSQFRQVPLNGDSRAGLLGQGSILTLTSMNERISPTFRGKWLLNTFFGLNPPPPAPNVAPLPDVTSLVRPMNMKERMEVHRTNPACASCHLTFEPLGLALGNFDAIGRWQDREDGVPIDSSGTFIDGTRFSGPAEFRGDLMQYRDAYLANITEKMMSFALGRGAPNGKLSKELSESELSSVRSVLRVAKVTDARWSSIVVGIVQSAPFQANR